mmetsp:Transcript_26443/g.75923  ORF Transcript_26443/g.75923 Transcript_26443/m.75923 type:complete len:315 (+) Transcript_26443:1278-2222(+)
MLPLACVILVEVQHAIALARALSLEAASDPALEDAHAPVRPLLAQHGCSRPALLHAAHLLAPLGARLCRGALHAVVGHDLLADDKAFWSTDPTTIVEMKRARRYAVLVSLEAASDAVLPRPHAGIVPGLAKQVGCSFALLLAIHVQHALRARRAPPRLPVVGHRPRVAAVSLCVLANGLAVPRGGPAGSVEVHVVPRLLRAELLVGGAMLPPIPLFRRWQRAAFDKVDVLQGEAATDVVVPRDVIVVEQSKCFGGLLALASRHDLHHLPLARRAGALERVGLPRQGLYCPCLYHHSSPRCVHRARVLSTRKLLL